MSVDCKKVQAGPQPLSIHASTVQVARRYGVGRTTVHNAVVRGEIPAFRVGGIYRIKTREIPAEVIDRWTRPRGADRIAQWPAGRLIYFLGGTRGYVKIGFTANLAERIRDLQVACPVQLKLLAHTPGNTTIEREYHARFAGSRTFGEWFKITPSLRAEIARLAQETPHD